MKTAAVLDPKRDPYRFDIFESVERFEDIIGSLTGVYMKLHYQELDKGIPNQALAEKYMNRIFEIRKTKNNFAPNDIEARDQLTELYLKEYKKLDNAIK